MKKMKLTWNIHQSSPSISLPTIFISSFIFASIFFNLSAGVSCDRWVRSKEGGERSEEEGVRSEGLGGSEEWRGRSGKWGGRREKWGMRGEWRGRRKGGWMCVLVRTSVNVTYISRWLSACICASASCLPPCWWDKLLDWWYSIQCCCSTLWTPKLDQRLSEMHWILLADSLA